MLPIETRLVIFANSNLTMFQLLFLPISWDILKRPFLGFKHFWHLNYIHSQVNSPAREKRYN